MKKTILWILLDLVVVAVFNTLFFVLGGEEHTETVWLSYGFIHFAYIMLLLTPILTRKGTNRSLFGYSIFSISEAYFIIELITGVTIVIIDPDSSQTALVVQVVIAGIYAVVLLANLIANENTAESVEKRDNEAAFIKCASARVKALIGKSGNRKVDVEIEKLYDFLHSSPTKSSDYLKPAEAEILREISELENAVFSKDNQEAISKSKEILIMAEKRNNKLKMRN